MPHKLPGFTSRTVQVKDLRMHYVVGGAGDPVVIVHGAWDSWWAWRDVATALAKRHTVILPAMRGLGYTSKPDTGYDADNLADDLHTLVTAMGYERFGVVGHDWGAMAAYNWAAQHPEAVTRLGIFEMAIPGVGIMEEAMAPQPGGAYLWHVGLLSVPDIAEMLIAPSLRRYMSWMFTEFAAAPDAVDAEALDHYVDLYQQPGALKAIMRYYQNFWVHGEQVRAHKNTRLQMPVLAYGGDACFADLTRTCMLQVADDVRGGVIPDCGHWIAEEQPEFVAGRLLEFLADDGGVVSPSLLTHAL
jgi:pimeloyl-ACP methyl ester carboxylesterase